MATVRKCYRGDCECNVEGAYCDACEVIVGTAGDCLTYTQKDIYKEVEGFSRDTKEKGI